MNQILIDRINLLCKKNNISISIMLKNCGLPSSTFDNIKKGSKPSFDKIAKIAEFFCVSVDYLIGRNETSSPKNYDKLTPVQKEEIERLIEMFIAKS